MLLLNYLSNFLSGCPLRFCVKGRFWEGRFKSQALLDEQAIISVMAYVDLNPVRACMADDLPRSDFTSVQRRISGNTLAVPLANSSFSPIYRDLNMGRLMPFDPGAQQQNAIPFSLTDYLEFVDYLGRKIHPNKRGVIVADAPALIAQLGLSHEWIEAMQEQRWLHGFGWAIGTTQTLQQARPHRMKGAVKEKAVKGLASKVETSQGTFGF